MEVITGDERQPPLTAVTEEQTNSKNCSDQVDTAPSESAKPEEADEVVVQTAEDAENHDHHQDHSQIEKQGIDGYIQVITPDSHLPKPEPPPGLSNEENEITSSDFFGRSKSLTETFGAAVDMPSIGKFFKERSSSLSAIAKRFSQIRNDYQEDEYDSALRRKNELLNRNRNRDNDSIFEASEFNISGLKVVVRMKPDNDDGGLLGRVSFFSRSNCRDCSAVREFFKQIRGLKFVEINVDVYPRREKELVQRTGTPRVPQIFFNEKLFGGLVALNSLRNSGEFDRRLKEMLGKPCPKEAPAPPVYGFDDPEEDDDQSSEEEDLVRIVKVLRQKMPIDDRLMKMKIVRNCFAGGQMVEVLIQHLDCGRKKGVEIGKQLARQHFIHHVFGENGFEDGNHLYRFLEHEPFIPKSYNFRVSTNDRNPKPAVDVGKRLYKLMSAILESYASDDRLHVDYDGISKSEEFRRYTNLVVDLQRVDLTPLSTQEKTSFFLNLYNAMAIHAVIRIGSPQWLTDRRSFYSDFNYVVGGSPFSLNAIKNGVLRNNRRSPYSFVKPFGSGDGRLQIMAVVDDKVNPLVHFGLCNGTRSSPAVRFFTSGGVETELRSAAREFFKRGGIDVDLETRTVYLSRMMKWFGGDFGQEKEILKWVMSYLDGSKAGLVNHLSSDGGPVHIIYQNYDWSLNC